MTRVLKYLICLSMGAAGLAAAADTYPSKVIRLVVPFAAGSGSDSIARTLTSRLGEATGWRFVVDNKGGAGGMLGAQEAKRAAPDGYTWLFAGNSTHGANSALYKNLGYDPVQDFEPITLVGAFPLVLLARPGLGLGSVGELVQKSKVQPDLFSYGAASAGPRVASETLAQRTGARMRYVPYKSSPQILTDLMGGHIDVAFMDTVAAASLARNGSLKALAVTSARRFEGLPQVPTVAEQGLAGYELLNWSAVFVPKGVPAPTRDLIYQAVSRIVASESWHAYVAGLGGYAETRTPAQTADWVRREIRTYSEVLSAAGVQPE